MILCAEGDQDVFVPNFPCPELISDPLVAYACGRVHGCKNTREAGARLREILGDNYFVYDSSPRHVSIHLQDPHSQEKGPRLAMLVDTSEEDGMISVNGVVATLKEFMPLLHPSALV